mmetsp:Transcript_86405/g.172909  ORF Transcript_86405/g.172909 Transcript_86405/m.172909 type:complete len:213 (-) Transcript_86405:150-788(-)
MRAKGTITPHSEDQQLAVVVVVVPTPRTLRTPCMQSLCTKVPPSKRTAGRVGTQKSSLPHKKWAATAAAWHRLCEVCSGGRKEARGRRQRGQKTLSLFTRETAATTTATLVTAGASLLRVVRLHSAGTYLIRAAAGELRGTATTTVRCPLRRRKKCLRSAPTKASRLKAASQRLTSLRTAGLTTTRPKTRRPLLFIRWTPQNLRQFRAAAAT